MQSVSYTNKISENMEENLASSTYTAARAQSVLAFVVRVTT